VGIIKLTLILAIKTPKGKSSATRTIYLLGFYVTDVTRNADDEFLAASVAGQPRGDCPYLKNLDFVGAAPCGAAIAGILSV
jgi:hypothetical protein